MKKMILIVEDDGDIAESIRYNLERESDLTAAIARTGEEGLELIEKSDPSLVILDINLPRMSGFEICRRLRHNAETARLPIIILTARTDESDTVLGLELGADDYVTKPFSMRELMARVRAILRRAEVRPLDRVLLDHGRIEIELQNQLVTVAGEVVHLTRKEFALLALLAQSPGRLLTRDYLLDEVWGAYQEGDTRTLDVHIRRLRQKLGNDELIETVIGSGYRLRKS